MEVKTRTERSLVSPFEAVTPQKQRKIFATAEVFLQQHPSQLQPRFDAAAVYLRDGKIVGESYCQTLLEYNGKEESLCAILTCTVTP